MSANSPFSSSYSTVGIPAYAPATQTVSANASTHASQPASALNTTDTAAFSGQVASPADLNTLQATVNDLEQRVAALEEQVSQMTQQLDANSGAAPAANGTLSTLSTNDPSATPSSNGPSANATFAPTAPALAPNAATAGSAPVAPPVGQGGYVTLGTAAAPTAGNTTANGSVPTTFAPASGSATPAGNQALSVNNFAPAPNTAAIPAAPSLNASAAPAATPTLNAAPTANAATDPQTQAAALWSQLEGLRENVQQQLQNIQAYLRSTLGASSATAGGVNAQSTNPQTAGALQQRTALQQQAAGLNAVAFVLSQAKLTNLTPQEQAVVNPAMAQVQQIAQEIGAGAEPNQFNGQLFQLKQTLTDPLGAAANPLVAPGEAVVQQASSQRANAEAQLANLNTQSPLSAVQQQEKAYLTAYDKANTQIIQALDGAKLNGLTPQAQANAQQAIAQLGQLASALNNPNTNPASATSQIYTLAQTLKNPAASGPSQQTTQAAQVLSDITQAESTVETQLGLLDQKVAAGTPAQEYQSERDQLLDNLASLNALSKAVQTAKIDPSNPTAAREVTSSLQRADQIAQALGNGDDPTKYRSDLFVLKQTFKDPVGSLNNPAIQSGAAALQIIGQAEAANLKKQQQIANQVAAGADPRQFDTQLAQLEQQEQDFRTMRTGIESANFSRLTAAQQAQGAGLIDQMRNIAMKVASGTDFSTLESQYASLVKQLDSLGSAPAAASATVSAASTNTLQPGATYTVQSGDYLTKIARDQLGDPSRYTEIVQLNKDKYPSLVSNPDMIYPGWQLVLPKQQ